MSDTNGQYEVNIRKLIKSMIEIFKITIQSTNGVKERGVDQILEPLSEFLQQCQSENPEDRPDSKEVVSRLIEEYKKQQPLSNFNIYDS